MEYCTAKMNTRYAYAEWLEVAKLMTGRLISQSANIEIGVGFNPTDARNYVMRTTQQFSITLPNEMADAVREKVASGEYATESEVIRDGLRVLLARDRAVDKWLLEQVVPAYDALKADPSRAVSVDSVRARLAKEHKATVEKK